MRHTMLLGAVLSLATSLAAQAPATPSPDQDAVRRVLEAYAGLVQAKNLAGADTLFAPGGGVHIIEGAGVNHGWADYRDNHLGRELPEFTNFRYFAIEPQVRGELAWASFRYELAAHTANGHIEMEGRGTAVLEKQNGRWVIVHQHTSGRRKTP